MLIEKLFRRFVAKVAGRLVGLGHVPRIDAALLLQPLHLPRGILIQQIGVGFNPPRQKVFNSDYSRFHLDYPATLILNLDKALGQISPVDHHIASRNPPGLGAQQKNGCRGHVVGLSHSQGVRFGHLFFPARIP